MGTEARAIDLPVYQLPGLRLAASVTWTRVKGFLKTAGGIKVVRVKDGPVVGVHMVGGLVGTLLIGFLATSASPAGVDGLFYGGGVDQLWRQAVGAFTVLIVSFVVTYIIGFVLHKTMGFRIDHEHELEGIDRHEHAETAYELLGQPGVRSMSAGFARATTTSGDRHDTSAAQNNEGAVNQ